MNTTDKPAHTASFPRFMGYRPFIAALLSVFAAIAVYKAADTANIQAITGMETGAYSVSGGQNVVATLAFDDEGDTQTLADKLNEEESPAPAPVRSSSYYIYLNVDGMKRRLAVTKNDTVEDILDRAGIELGHYDETDIPLEETVAEGGIITVTRISYVTIKKREILPYTTVTFYSPKLAAGTKKVLTPGENGSQTVSIRQYIVNDEIISETIISCTVDKEPVEQREASGFPSKPVSTYDFNYSFDENCEPVGYENVLRSKKSAGYSAREGSGTASGLKAYVGNVAVDPKVIPYGTKLFIKSSDGKYIYGYAVAADTGTALVQGRITVDLFYATYQESADHGIKEVDIFILETPQK